jgi:hypothetical protein
MQVSGQFQIEDALKAGNNFIHIYIIYLFIYLCM